MTPGFRLYTVIRVSIRKTMNAPVQVFGVILDYTVFLVLGYFPFLVFETKALRFPSKTCSGTSCVEVQAVYVYTDKEVTAHSVETKL